MSVPDRGSAHLALEAEELGVATRAHVQGNAWLQIWMPGLLEGRGGAQVRAAVVAHLGELSGLIVVERRADDPPFTDEDDRVLAELARQVGLALHNVRLDSALQASLEQLEDAQPGAGRLPPPHRHAPPTSPGARSSATCTTAPSSTSSPSR